mgnify:CR=1 FL=1
MAGLRWKAIFLIGMLLAFPPNGQAEQPVSPPRMQAGDDRATGTGARKHGDCPGAHRRAHR